MLNFVYCFDENYNSQALTSINSLTEKSSEKINLFIIHENPKSLNINLINKKNILELKVYDIEFEDIEFPNISGSHVSRATYFRFYLSKFYINLLRKLLSKKDAVFIIIFSKPILKIFSASFKLFIPPP